MCSTVDPNWSMALEARLAQHGILYVDGPILAARRVPPAADDHDDGRRHTGRLRRSRCGAGGHGRQGLSPRSTGPVPAAIVKIINQLLAGVHRRRRRTMALGLRVGVDRRRWLGGHHPQRRQQLDVRKPYGPRWRATTRRCRRSTSSSRTWAWCWTRRAPASFRCRWRATAHQMFMPGVRCRPRAGRQRGDQDFSRASNCRR